MRFIDDVLINDFGLDLTGWALGQVFGISADGRTIVGHGVNPSGQTDDLGLDLAGWTLDTALGISADGLTIVGQGTNPNGEFEAWIAIIPEPSTALLLAGGLAVLAGTRARHRRA